MQNESNLNFYVSSLSELDDTIDVFRKKYPKSKMIFRGQSVADWKLESTLERFCSKNKLDFIEYCRNIFSIAGYIQSAKGLSFDLIDLKNIVQNKESDNYNNINYLPSYPYWVFLRQYGYPSPLLDWSLSPHIATFFSLWQSKCDSALWIYIEKPEGFKIHGTDMTNIEIKGPFTPNEKRHYLQQAVYTIAWKWEIKNGRRIFMPYETIRKDIKQDLFIKIVLNKSMHDDCINYFDQSNLNIYSLMQDTDSLMKYLTYKYFF